MNQDTFSYNLLMEFHSFLNNLAHYEDEFKKYTDFSRPDDFVEKLIDSTYCDLSPMMLSDLNIFYRDSTLVPYALIASWIQGKARNYREFRAELEKMDAGDLARLILASEEEEAREDESEEEAFERIETQFKTLETDETIIDSYRELKKFPTQTMNRIRLFLDQFYTEYFEKAEPEIEAFLKEKVEQHSAIYNKDSQFFKKSLIRVSFDDQCSEDIEYLFYIGYLNGGQQTYHKESCRVFCYYGYKFEQLFDPGFYERRMAELFKTLGDETRLKMIHLLSRKSWYSSELAEELGINKATVSYHMKALTGFDIVDISLGKNRRIYYRIKKDILDSYFSRFIDSLTPPPEI